MLNGMRRRVNDKIFVSIAGLNEPFTKQTVLSAMSAADRSDRLSFGIFIQDTHDYDHGLEDIDADIRILKSKGTTQMGIGISRLSASILRNYSEDFYLQVDAHVIFSKGWDTILLDRYRELLAVADKPIISMHGPLWAIVNGVPVDQHGEEIDPYNYLGKGKEIRNAAIIQPDDMPERRGTDIVSGGPIFFDDFVSSNLLTAQFIFTKIDFIDEVGNDPLILFLADEPTMSMRAWTRGYRIFAIKDIVFLHLDKASSPEIDWRVSSELEKNSDRDSAALERVRSIMTGKTTGYYGAPSLELLQQYDSLFRYSIIEYFNSQVHIESLDDRQYDDDPYQIIGSILRVSR